MSSSPVGFRELMNRTAEAVGRHHIPVRDTAGDINEFLEQSAIHHTLIHRLVRSVYRANRCCHLDASVQQCATLEILGALRGELVRSSGTDVDQLNLVDAVGTAMQAAFQEVGTHRPPRAAKDDPEHEECIAGVTPTTRYCLNSEA